MPEFNLASLFEDASKSISTHRRSVAAAKKYAIASVRGGRDSQMNFCESFKNCLFVVLNLKKGTLGADKVLKFVKGFLMTAYGTTLIKF